MYIFACVEDISCLFRADGRFPRHFIRTNNVPKYVYYYILYSHVRISIPEMVIKAFEYKYVYTLFDNFIGVFCTITIKETIGKIENSR